MKGLRIFGIIVASLLAAGVVLVVAAFWIPAIPTAFANRVIDGQEGVGGAVGRVDLDWNRITLSELDVFQEEGARLQLEAAEVRIAFLSLMRGDVRISRLHATGAVADLRQLAEREPPDPGDPFEFDGIFRPIREAGTRFWVDDVRVEGRILLPEARDGTFHLTGGGIAPGSTGELSANLVIIMPEGDATGMERVSEETHIAVSQDDIGLTAVVVTSETVATGPQRPTDGRVSKTAELRLTEDGESYRAAILGPDGDAVAALLASFTYGQDLLAFSYHTAIDERTIEAWGLAGMAPSFSLQGSGEGSVDLSALTGAIDGNLTGRVVPPVADGEAPRPEMSFMFAFSADSDGRTATVGAFDLEIQIARERVMQVEVPGPVTFALDDPVRSLPEDLQLLVIDLSMPLADLAPEDVASGRAVGRMILAKRGQALLLESPRAVAIENLVLIQADRPPMSPLTVTVVPGFTYLAERLDFHLEGIGGTIDGQSFLDGAFEGSALVALADGEISVRDAAVEGSLRIDVDALWGVLLPPEADAGNQGVADLRIRGTLAQIGGPGEAEINLRLTGVAADRTPERVEELAMDLIARLSEANEMTLDGPIRVTGPAGVTELQASAKAGMDPVRFDAALTGDTVFADDLMLLAAAYSPPEGVEETPPIPEEPAPPVSDEPDTAPAWAGVAGQARAEIARIILGDNIITDLSAVLTVDERRIELTDFSAAFADQPMLAEFQLEFTPSPERPYRLATAFRVNEFDLASLDRAMRGQEQPPLLEGIFNVDGRFHGNGPNLQTMPQWVEGELTVTATRATYYPLGSLGSGDIVSSVVGQLGGLAEGLLRGRDQTGYAAAVREVVALLQGVETNELTIESTLRAGLDVSVDRFELLTPQLSFVGSGRLPYEMGKRLFEQHLTLDLEIGAAGTAARAFNTLRMLSGTQNDFGYYVGPQFENSGPIGSPSSTLVSLLRASAANYLTRRPIDLPDVEGEEPPRTEEKDEADEGPLDTILRSILRDR